MSAASLAISRNREASAQARPALPRAGAIGRDSASGKNAPPGNRYPGRAFVRAARSVRRSRLIVLGRLGTRGGTFLPST